MNLKSSRFSKLIQKYLPGTLAGGIALFVILEFSLRIIAPPWVTYKLKEKELHCTGDPSLRAVLCPNRSILFHHPSGFEYRVTTNEKGERIVVGEDGKVGQQGKSVWLLGDSITMGWGLNDEDTFASILGQKSNWKVRNLGVDSLGSLGVLHILKSRLKEADRKPDALVWVFHFSDFIDDPRDESFQSSSIKRALYRINHRVASISALYNWLRWVVEEVQLSRRENRYDEMEPVAPPSDSITFNYIEKSIELARREEIPLAIVIYPNSERETGLPSKRTPGEDAVAWFAERHGADVIDTRESFLNSPDGKELYLPEDGHPSPRASQLFADSIHRWLKNI